MVTLRELASESFGRITRRALEAQIAQLDDAMRPGEQPRALAPGRDGSAGVVVALTDARLLLSSGEPFAQPDFVAYPLTEIGNASPIADTSTWTLRVELTSGRVVTVNGMFDRDAQRFADALGTPASG